MHTQVKVADLLRLLYEAAADPRQWTAFIQSMLRETNATCSFVIALPFDDRAPLYHQVGFETSVLRTYHEHFVNQDIILDRFRNAGRKYGSWVGNRQTVLPDMELERSPFYNDYMRPMNLYHQAGANVGRVADYALAGMTLVRPRALGEFDQRTISLLRLLTPHLKQAFLLHHKLDQLHLGVSLLEQSLEATGAACLTIDSRGILQGRTSVAEKLLAEADGLCIVEDRLHATNPKEEKLLEALILGALRTGAGDVDPFASAAMGGELVINRRPPRRPLHVVVTPFHSDVEILHTQACALVFLIDPEARTHSRASLLRSLFGLTPSEAKLGDLLAEGLDVKLCAERMRITEASARFVLKRIFQKTGVKSQSGLMRLTLSLPCLPEGNGAIR